jgi:Na+/phosphate symporter
MGNMSYCRFQNTANDLIDCLDAMNEMLNNNGRDGYQQTLDDGEFRAMEHLIDYAREILEIADDVLELVEEAREDERYR